MSFSPLHGALVDEYLSNRLRFRAFLFVLLRGRPVTSFHR